MAITPITLSSPFSFIFQVTADAGFVLFSANFITGVVTSSYLPARTTAFLTERIQSVFSALGEAKAAFEPAFPGFCNSLVACTLLEDGALVQTGTAGGGGAEVTLSGIPDPANVAVTIPFSTSACSVGAP